MFERLDRADNIYWINKPGLKMEVLHDLLIIGTNIYQNYSYFLILGIF